MQTAKQLMQHLASYHVKVNADMLEHLQVHKPLNERIQLLVSHTINAHQIWISRVNGTRQDVEVFQLRPYEELILQNDVNQVATRKIIEEKDLQQTISYVNTKGQKFLNSINDMLLHVFNHSTYHRGQINQLLVQEGKKAMVSDFIVYNRTEVFDL